MYAEHLIKHIGLIKLKEGSTFAGTKVIKQFWKQKNIDTEGMYLNDGSGLSRYNAVSARQLSMILKYMYKESKYKEYFKETLPIAAESGTLRHLGKGTIIEGKIQAKSGSIRRVRAYAGYAHNANDEISVFTIIVNNYNCRDNEMKDEIVKIMESIVKQ